MVHSTCHKNTIVSGEHQRPDDSSVGQIFIKVGLETDDPTSACEYVSSVELLIKNEEQNIFLKKVSPVACN